MTGGTELHQLAENVLIGAPQALLPNGFHTVDYAISELAAGRMVLVVDDEDRENEGDLIFAGELATAALVAFMVRYSSGVICVPLPAQECDRLELAPMTAINTDPKGTAYTVSVDARVGVSTGISAADRAQTIRTLAAASTRPGDLSRPGHVFPLRANEGGVLTRPGHTEAAIDLMRMAGLRPVGAIAEVVSDDGSMARLPELRRFAAEHAIALITIADLVAHRRRSEIHIERVVDARLPLGHGEFRAIGFADRATGKELVALVHGPIGDGQELLVRIHAECLTGDVFRSLRCACGQQLDAALNAVVAAGRGIVLYVRGHEGRGIGLLRTLRGYEAADTGAYSVDATGERGWPDDIREYATVAQVLAALGVRSIRLLSDNPAQRAGLEVCGLSIAAMVPLPVDDLSENADGALHLVAGPAV